MISVAPLDSSIPANNQKIIEIYNKMRQGQLLVNKDYQRKLVWKRNHKLEFIDTVLKNFPFPEIYLAPGNLDQANLILTDEIVDGQQRLTTIRDYIEGTDIFALDDLSIQKFSDLTVPERTAFLNYEISVRYLKNMNAEQVREIFQRINKTDYALNSTERINAQWGDSEFVLFSKQLIEPEFESESVQYIIDSSERREFVNFFLGGEDEDDNVGVFSETDMSRMFALQYIMTLVVTLDDEVYFARNDKIKNYIEGFNEGFGQGAAIKDKLLSVIRFISSLGLGRTSRWYKKANLFSLICELAKLDVSKIDKDHFSMALSYFDYRATMHEFHLSDPTLELNRDELRYLDYAREAVNQKAARDYRGEFLRKLILESIL
ncbi:DUF262 domain-containing protein [Janthinobacterium sp. SUN128]|uniref:DUF262 domain-containing protein n=1 Tax=Janthinobacterium sp. SUN128 TaxID=3014790 RepID=UPI002713BE5B|nr:DUF262 domain-containing protein [Janthinobacterium sp. SUN128]MDO8035059.1 DUF262 domain-containing protein [Janthinobacterium sp. SUN128]